MPIFNEPNFPQPGKPPKVDDAAIARLRNIASLPQATREAATAIPLKKVYEPYNPYARKHRPVQTQKSSIALYGVAVSLCLAGALLLSTFFVQKFAEKQISKAIHKAVAPFSETADVKFGGVNVSLFKQSVTIRNIQITVKKNDEVITIAAAKAWGVDWPTLKQIALTRKPTMPKTLKFSLSNVHMDGTLLGPQAAGFLQAMGYQDLSFSTFTDLALNKGDFNLKNFHLEAKKMASFDLSVHLGHIAMPSKEEIAMIKKDPRALLAMSGEWTKATIRGFAFDFQDDTITRRVINFIEHNGETSPETLAKMALEINQGARDPASVDFVKPALTTLVQFFEHPSSLSLSAEPSKEVPFVSLLDEKTGGSINELAHKLNLTIQ